MNESLMQLNLTTPALLFPTVSLLLLAYTNRFVAIGNRIRTLYSIYKQEKSETVLQQISILRIRVKLIRNLQIVGISSIFMAVLSMLLIFENLDQMAKYSFSASLTMLMVAFGMAGWEIIISTRALNIQLKDLEDKEMEDNKFNQL